MSYDDFDPLPPRWFGGYAALFMVLVLILVLFMILKVGMQWWPGF